MMKTTIVTLTVVFLFAQQAVADISDAEACEQGKASYTAQGMTENDCLCTLGEAGKHMPPEMKQAFVESLLAQESNPMARLMALGLSMEEVMNAMAAYGAAVEEVCGLK